MSGYELEAVRRQLAAHAGLEFTRSRHGRRATWLCRSDHTARHRRLGAEHRRYRSACLSRHLRRGTPLIGQVLANRYREDLNTRRHRQRLPWLQVYAARRPWLCCKCSGGEGAHSTKWSWRFRSGREGSAYQPQPSFGPLLRVAFWAHGYRDERPNEGPMLRVIGYDADIARATLLTDAVEKVFFRVRSNFSGGVGGSIRERHRGHIIGRILSWRPS